ncbi:hypothetical protein KAFR_0B02910 [Kazachstania africana CBS 2517]|uniref:tRNA-splicing endonuclease subunit Sen2 n=1 Tax=Kazachstania africana (strain ATCC 22294 / BCRC 22015 / CBS 2517 / CECT 1963 / NBRC 1671 / NRRL Y-8276) TaxID=1071382 RepID=H2AQD8_KAZAF|nr:hypothetical protein KAFR_0B02910 [Kazachstania africana CBS 2517]CCF56588.1 hypothetical protein KAFR_0B02910 [Kazachstania africana CBS 2517]
MVKKYSNASNKRYVYPLPVHPTLNSNNPISWAIYLYKCYTNYESSQIAISITKNGQIMVTERESMTYLWEHGFFGTGTLSRSEPSWFSRTYNDDSSTNVLEAITERRRLQRLEFKNEREKITKRLNELRKKRDINSAEDIEGIVKEETRLLEIERESLRNFKEKQESLSASIWKQKDAATSLDIDLVNYESLELMPVEALFLSFAIPVLNIRSDDLLNTLFHENANCETINRFINKYVAYHHYRSHGWCVRSGIKFGTDYLLYKRGPPFQHAEICVMVIDSQASNDYTWYSTLSRVSSGAKKTLLLCYVEVMLNNEEVMELWQKKDLTTIFTNCKVGEVIYRRWVPGKNRD